MHPFDLAAVFDSLLREVLRWQVWAQLVALVACALIAWPAARAIRARLRLRHRGGDAGERLLKLRGVRGLGELLFPTLIWMLLLIVQFVGDRLGYPVAVLHLAMVLVFSFVAIRLIANVLRRVFLPSAPLAAFERSIAIVVWTGVALHVLGVLPELLQAADAVVFTPGKVSISLLQVLQGAVTIGVTLILALWAGAALESRLMNSATLDASLRVVLSRAGNALLLTVAVLVSLSMVGIDLTVLSIFGGALGVGLGLGLQRIASSYVSGFIILLDRSLRIGDLITVDKYNGTVTQIRTRYTVVKALDGNDALIPNDLLVSQPVTNHSYTSRQGRFSIRIQISYDSDVDQALDLLVEAAKGDARVLDTPPPKAFLAGFAADGIDLEVGFWISDPEAGTMGVRSGINRRIWRGFQQHGIRVPKIAAGVPLAPSVKPPSKPDE